MNLKDFKIGIVGRGVVGEATAKAYRDHVAEVRCYDVDNKKVTHTFEQTLQSDLIFVCLPTPQAAVMGRRDCDISIVESFFSRVHRSQRHFVLRSTVPIGFTESMKKKYDLPQIVHSPEFLTARTAEHDAENPSINLIGETNRTSCQSYAGNLLFELYQLRFPDVPCYTLYASETEAVKLFLNGFFAVKIAYFNEIKKLSDRHSLSWDDVKNTMLAEGRINPNHTEVPGPDGMPGFGGACLPKDLNSLISQIEELGLAATMTAAAELRNRAVDRPLTWAVRSLDPSEMPVFQAVKENCYHPYDLGGSD